MDLTPQETPEHRAPVILSTMTIETCPDCGGFLSSPAHMTRCYAAPQPIPLCPCGCGRPQGGTLNRPGHDAGDRVSAPQRADRPRPCDKNRYETADLAASALPYHAASRGLNPWSMKIAHHESCDGWHIVSREARS